MSLRSLFDASAPRSRDLFTNRVSEAAAFGDALGLMKSEARRQDLLDDLWQPCRNVLNFYGLGGAGKSALTDHLRLLVPSNRFGRGVLVAQFDMSIVSARSSEAVLIGLFGHSVGVMG